MFIVFFLNTNPLNCEESLFVFFVGGKSQSVLCIIKNIAIRVFPPPRDPQPPTISRSQGNKEHKELTPKSLPSNIPLALKAAASLHHSEYGLTAIIKTTWCSGPWDPHVTQLTPLLVSDLNPSRIVFLRPLLLFYWRIMNSFCRSKMVIISSSLASLLASPFRLIFDICCALFNSGWLGSELEHLRCCEWY